MSFEQTDSRIQAKIEADHDGKISEIAQVELSQRSIVSEIDDKAEEVKKKKLRSGRNNINALPKQRPVTPPHTALPAACRTGCGLSTLTVEFNPIHHELTVGFRQCYICFIVLVLVAPLLSQLAVHLASSLHKSTTLQFYSLILVKVAIWGSKFD